MPCATSAAGLCTIYLGEQEPIVPVPVEFRVNLLDGVPDNVVPVPPGGGIPPVVLIVPRRNNGPIVDLDLATGTAISVQYTGFSATREIDCFRIWNSAKNLDDFREGLQFFDVGSQNWAYGDIDGNIAYFTSAEIPIREDLQAGMINVERSSRSSSGTARAATSGFLSRTRSRGRRSRMKSCRWRRCLRSSTRRLLHQRQQRPGGSHPRQRPVQPIATRRRHLLPGVQLRRSARAPDASRRRSKTSSRWEMSASKTCRRSKPMSCCSMRRSSRPTSSTAFDNATNGSAPVRARGSGRRPAGRRGDRPLSRLGLQHTDRC